jgi:hypothetical protein
VSQPATQARPWHTLTPQPQVAPQPPPAREHEWFAVGAGGREEGPMSTGELLRALAAAPGEAATWVWSGTAQPHWWGLPDNARHVM